MTTKSNMTISHDQAGQRLDNFIQALDRKVPRSIIYKWIRSGQVRVNSKRIKPMYKLMPRDELRLPPQCTISSKPTDNIPDGLIKQLRDALLYEDDNFLVVNKPAHLPCHSGYADPFGLIDIVRAGISEKAELVHRLDKQTSGCLLIAKKRASLVYLNQQMRDRLINKTYLCLVKGKWKANRHHIDLALKKVGNRVQVAKDGANAISHVSVQQHLKDCSLLRVKIDTGRTHQIRVHTAYFGQPIVGDDRYGDFDLNRTFNRPRQKLRLALHAAQLEFCPADGARALKVEAPLPDDLNRLIAIATER